MTLPVYAPNFYTGNGATATYNYGFKIFAKTDLYVVKTDLQGTETVLVVDTDYTVSGVGNAGGGSITLTAGNLTSGFGLAIHRIRPLTQTTDIRNQGAFYPEIHEDTFDDLVMKDQQQQQEINRALRLSDSINETLAKLKKTASQRAGKALVFDSAGNPNVDDYSAVNYQAMVGTSATSVAIGTGSKTFETQANKSFSAGQFVLIASQANSANYMHGQITSYSGTTLVVNVTNTGGTGTYADWKITVSGSRGAQGDRAGLRYNFSTDIADSDPGQGVFKYNNATIGSVTQIFIDIQDQAGNDISAYIDSWDDSTNTVKGYLEIKSNDNSDATVNIWRVDGWTTASGYRKITVTHVSGSLPSNGEVCVISFYRAGDIGAGNTIAPATNTNNYIPQWDGANSKTLKDGIDPTTLQGVGKFFEAYMSSGQTIQANTGTLLQMNTENYDSNGVFDNSASNYKVVIPSGETWFLYGRAAFDGVPDQVSTKTFIYKNGVSIRETRNNASGADVVPAALLGIPVTGNGSDYYQMYIWHNHTSQLTTRVGSVENYFGGFRIK